MLEKVLFFLRNQVNRYLKLKTGSEDKLILSRILDKDGKLLVTDLGMTLVNIEEESTMRNMPFYKETPQGTMAKINPEVMVNLYVLFTANFSDDEFGYRESLKFISRIISFFQVNRVFTPKLFPELDPSIEKISAELFSMNFEQQNHLWGALGAKSMTSVMYKLRVIAISEDEIKMEAPPITRAELET